jgi:hypothetical protein
MKAVALILVVLAIVTGIVPQFTDCHSQGRSLTLQNGKTVDMKCHWTSEAEIAVAAPLALVGGLLFFSKRKETQRMLSILGMGMGVFAVLLPTALIGVCANPEMICNSIMKPTLIFSGTVAAAASLIGIALSGRTDHQEQVLSSGQAV